ncbi:GRRM system radical SAM/SPASM domain protein [Candidatus Synechococcus calcipolaris G9]|uniref:GRRM system radical SAM/SPASM domain protein n=1 Tax=Candidatus Synechococcus calcipolaris G9 TaxID=1497997 RepID=A0ABT6EXV9_9SYNE|nr:cyclophane-forming radical SAM/SPASM peptide maturase GrrM/OscB [Candidatus Synechococcus calcipolaris]MDG2990640.1 GRRM system radical SAM/SPASM domain protein [Candidatus Synechococcus calcipolaris G9]
MMISDAELARFGPFRLVVIQPTPFCNIDCDYCYLPGRSQRQSMDLALLEPLFKNLFSSRFLGKHFTVCWHAGEPLTLPLEFYQKAFAQINALEQQHNSRQCYVTHAIQTNGTLITPDWCDFFKSEQISVGVSLDGPAFLHDAHRKTRTGLGTHQATLRGIKHLQNNQINFHIIAVLTKDALAYPDEIFEFFQQEGIHNVGFNIEEIEGSNQESSLSQNDTRSQYRGFMARFWQLTKATKGTFKVREFDRVSEHLYTDKAMGRNQLCTPFAMVNVDVNGNFATYSPELLGMTSSDYGRFILGNVCTDSFEAVCQTETFQRIYQDIQAGVTACRQTCDYFPVCGGGAPSNKYWENGSFASTETLHCLYTQKILTDLILTDVEQCLGLA